ncbi:hypothetical protein I2I05_03645 [Hymenobacter sp. BT683]|uniref:DUF4234 domain-containing protein n=1 Tax=Hymenobacter jeongseonensis TaxID=2791027 RepID=A0ABS0IDQ0_9BACT|nr:hypothetical protein [Hymenobacter jeongseonensis]MBF9236481.1 hypothetical protein [Hymenobacter jeongseonensis]
MEHSILKAKSWQVFLVLLACYFISWFVKDDDMSEMLKLIGFSIFCIWLALIGNTMNQIEKANEKTGVTLFVVNVVLVMAAPIISKLLSNSDFIVTPSSFNAKGLWVVPALYVFIAYIQIHWFVASSVVANEQGQKPEFSHTLGTAVLLIIWPIGVWFIQPRLNRIYNAIQADTLDYPRT